MPTNRSARLFRNNGTPRGLLALTDRQREAARLVLDAGRTRVIVSRIYGVDKKTVSRWVSDYLDEQRDARHLRPRTILIEDGEK